VTLTTGAIGASHGLTAAERVAYHDEGYLVRRGVFRSAELEVLRLASEALVENLVKDRQGRRQRMGSYVFESDRLADVVIKWEGDSDVVHGIEPVCHLSPVLAAWAADARLIEPMAHCIDDPGPTLFTEKLNLKRPAHGGPNPFHQDLPYWADIADDAARIATAMIFLDDADTTNGCLEVVPGSHRRGVWPTRADSDPFGGLETDPAATAEVSTVPLEVEAGAVAFFGPLLLHKSSPNTSPQSRRALLYSYQPAGLAHVRECLRRRRPATHQNL